ncbi:MAG: 30S ribosome-binding factor RbfA [Clostridia bacterium]|nr:30S ribosome-binding factor RbfA [Clostridia bacterium]
MNFRIDRVNSELQKSISEIIRRLKDPRITSMVSVIAVETSKDLGSAKVFVSCYGGDAQETLAALKKCAGFIRHELRNEYRELRTMPSLNFFLDTSMAYGEKIDALLEGLKKNGAD